MDDIKKAGVKTPWENGKLESMTDWSAHSRGSSSPNDMNENRKNSVVGGREWDHPWEEKCKPVGTLGPMDKVDEKR